MPREQPARHDEWLTPDEIVALVLAQWDRIDLDPCAHPESPATKAAARHFDIRAGQDGLALPWPDKARVYCNPPYGRGQVKKWGAKCAAHAAAGGESLLLVNTQIGSDYWRDTIWPATTLALACNPRIRFILAGGGGKGTQNTADSVLVYMGPHPDRFAEVWSARGTVVSVHTLQGAAGKARELAAPEADVSPSERASGLLRDLVAAAQARHGDLYARLAPLQAASQAAKSEHGPYSLAVMEAERAVSLALTAAIGAVHEAARIESAVQAFERTLHPATVSPVVPQAAKTAARNAAKVARAERLAQHRDAQEAAQAATESEAA